MSNIKTLEEAKAEFNLKDMFPNAKRVGTGLWRVIPCPKCGHKEDFTIYEPYAGKGNSPYWTYSSFKNCYKGGTIVDYFMEFEGMTQDEAIKKVLRESNNMKKTPLNIKKAVVIPPPQIKENKYNFNELVDKLHKNLLQDDEAMNYFINRGLTDKTITKYKLGYCDDGYNVVFKDYEKLQTKKLNINAYKFFFPVFNDFGIVDYVITRHDNSIDDDPRYWNMKDLSIKLFNERYLRKQSNFLFICEGIMDSLSIEELGFNSIALNSANNHNIFKNLVINNLENLKDTTFIIALDNDEKGKEIVEKLESYFIELKLNYRFLEMNDMYKDVNEWLVGDSDSLKNSLNNLVTMVQNEDFTCTYLDNLITKINENKNKKIISTGFYSLDNMLGGGLYSGLYGIGAGSSIGKTTFALQMADNIARSGQDVLFFSLEMSKLEMVGKSLTREMFKISPSPENIPSTRSFLNGYYDKELLNKTIEKYKKTSEHIAIIEGSFDVGVNEIKQIINKYMTRRKTKPVVFIDYLQVLKSNDPRMNDKQAVDYNIVELKRISRDLDIPIVLISSINRGNYLSNISFESFKESGSIEYTCDVVIGLQLSVVNRFGEKEFAGEGKLNARRETYNKAKSEDPRSIELVILKNRNGISYSQDIYNYYPKFNYYESQTDLRDFKDIEINEEDNKEIQMMF